MTEPKASKKWAIAGQLLGVLVLLGIVAWLQGNRLRELISPAADTVEPRAEAQALEVQSLLTLLKTMPSLGFDNLVADWVFLRFLQYFGNFEFRQATSYELSPDYFEVILSRDPYYYPFYTYLSSSVSIFAGQPQQAVELQRQGLQQLTPTLPPRSYLIWRNKGIDELLFLDDVEAAIASHLTAAEWASQSPYPEAQQNQAALLGMADFLAQSQAQPGVQTQVQIGAWAQVLTTAPDDKTRAVAVENIEALGGAVVPNEDGSYSIRLEADNPPGAAQSTTDN
ncbi:MAG: hypothetical protein ACFBSG_06345 [Leptolyngbyaceae cyanobacterium]